MNNRQYGLMLNYGGAAVKWGWHAAPDTLVDALRDAAGDYAAHSAGGLYLPPLSRASVGIMNIGNGKNHTFAITPTAETIFADALDMSMGNLISTGASAASIKWAGDVFGAAASGSCSEAATGFTIAAIPDQSTVMNLLTSKVPSCLKDVLTIAARNELAQRDGIDFATITQLSAAVTRLEQIISAGAWAKIENGLGNVLDFGIDSKYAAVPSLGFGFSVLSHYTYTGPSAPAQPQQNPHPAGSPGGSAAGIGPGGSPAPPPTSNPQPAPAGQPATVYDNYGPALKGYPVCRGNPGQPASMPGGTVSQTFTMPAGVTALTQAIVQVDPADVTVHATLSVNGIQQAAADATAAGDTMFTFGTVPVQAGTSVTLRLTMSGTDGKIITVYSASHAAGPFTVSDSCPDGAANLSTQSAGLRSKITGTTAWPRNRRPPSMAVGHQRVRGRSR